MSCGEHEKAAEAATELRRLHEVERQRDELLEALENIVKYEHDFCTHPEDLREIARYAIASVKGQP